MPLSSSQQIKDASAHITSSKSLDCRTSATALHLSIHRRSTNHLRLLIQALVVVVREQRIYPQGFVLHCTVAAAGKDPYQLQQLPAHSHCACCLQTRRSLVRFLFFWPLVILSGKVDAVHWVVEKTPRAPTEWLLLCQYSQSSANNHEVMPSCVLHNAASMHFDIRFASSAVVVAIIDTQSRCWCTEHIPIKQKRFELSINVIMALD
jgi:hypothetical protein